MNFLAHLYLSGSNSNIQLGNFIADFVKGKNYVTRFEPEIVKGIELHREIDHFTDHHPVVQESKNRLRPKYRHYSGVIVDVFYDHFLAINWKTYSNESLTDFASQAYQMVRDHESIIPLEVNAMLPSMVKGNWLVNYGTIEGIHRALSGMSRRTPFESKMEEASRDLEENFSYFQKEFNQFFPELELFCQKWLATHSSIYN